MNEYTAAVDIRQINAIFRFLTAAAGQLLKQINTKLF